MLRFSCLMFVCLVLFSSCSSTPTPTPPPTVDVSAVQTQAAVAIFATQTASVPTATATPKDTATPRPTNTPNVTNTPVPPTLNPDDAVRLLDWTNYTSDSGHYIYIDGEIQNATTEPMAFIEITVKLLDSNRKLVATESSYADAQRLGSGEKTTFKIMTPNRSNIAHIAIANITWKWAGNGTPQALDIPTLTPIPPSNTPAPTRTPVVHGFNKMLTASPDPFSWQAIETREISELDPGWGVIKANGKFVVVRVDCKADNEWKLRGCRDEGFILRDGSGKIYEEDTSASDAARPLYFDESYVKMLRSLYFSYNTGVKYEKGTILHDTVAFDVPANAKTPYYLLWNYDEKHQIIRVK